MLVPRALIAAKPKLLVQTAHPLKFLFGKLQGSKARLVIINSIIAIISVIIIVVVITIIAIIAIIKIVMQVKDSAS